MIRLIQVSSNCLLGNSSAAVFILSLCPFPVSSECGDERLKLHNGNCYLFNMFLPIDWWTAQQVCRSIGAQLASIASTDELR